jgi:hypothetical protein
MSMRRDEEEIRELAEQPVTHADWQRETELSIPDAMPVL